ncbi:hypothetical protein HYFRA_00001739 [Hymenoscyphus fraxineus]|uniref:Uncharacterized protein n=1 Tax=Hymenoscyphus fraxineus TaxID=746836 RepID=A0A9N9L4E9_9HELO|nr:hypothetical protein HYFRA_00001739 [Hymenoscyphus fraxineus]
MADMIMMITTKEQSNLASACGPPAGPSRGENPTGFVGEMDKHGTEMPCSFLKKFTTGLREYVISD